MSKFATIIITHWAGDANRSNYLRKSLTSLLGSTKYPYELIVVDNGGNPEDSRYLLDLTEKGIINVYLKNAANMHFGYGRNQALRIANGDYFAICDNDIIYNEGWLETCIRILEKYPNKKIYATPIYNVAHWRAKYWSSEVLELDNRPVRLNLRAGSNCWVARREDFEVLGDFWIHRIAGSRWTDNAVHNGYLAAVTPDIMVNDFGFRRGYDLNDAKPVCLNLHNGEEVYFNGDEFVARNPDKTYRTQKHFLPKYLLK